MKTMTRATPPWLDADDVGRWLDPSACIAAVERAFRRLGEGTAQPPAVCGIHVESGTFHVKAAAMDELIPVDGRSQHWFVAKVNANFPGNPRRYGLPTVQGVVLLMDASNGRTLALLDSGMLTALRTAAATAVAARVLARPDSRTAAIVGCGVQGRAHGPFLAAALPSLERVLMVDVDREAARAAATEARDQGLVAEAMDDVAAAARISDVVVTCTPSRQPLLDVADVAPGAFVAGVGADNEEKHELAPSLLASATVVVDVLAQCERMGDLHHAIAAGAMTRDDVHAELGAVLVGRVSGRRSPDEVIVFDSTGMALQDVAAAAVVYQRALAGGGAEAAG